jgi:peptidoglycan-associated lipoprotein
MEGTGMMDIRKMLHAARFAVILAAALAVSACARSGEDAQANAAGQASPGSQQDFIVNVGDRVFSDQNSASSPPQSARR